MSIRCNTSTSLCYSQQVVNLTHFNPGDMRNHDPVTVSIFQLRHVKILNTALIMGNAHSTGGILHHLFGPETLLQLVSSDSRLANLLDQGTQVGYSISLTDDSRRINCIHISIQKRRRTARLVLCGGNVCIPRCFPLCRNAPSWPRAFPLQICPANPHCGLPVLVTRNCETHDKNLTRSYDWHTYQRSIRKTRNQWRQMISLFLLCSPRPYQTQQV